MMTPEETFVVNIAAKTFELTIGKFISSCIEDLSKFWGKNTDDTRFILKGGFEEYLARSFKKQSYITTLLKRDNSIKLKDIYVQQRIISGKYAEKQKKFLVQDMDSSFFNKNKNTLIVDTAGMGKSTLLKVVLTQAVENSTGIPIIIELRHINTSRTLLEEIIDQLSSIKERFPEKILYKLLESGEMIICLDGYDEIKDDLKDEVTNQITNLVSKAGQNAFIITSRDESSLSVFNNFTRFTIEPLSEEEAYDLILKYGQGDSLTENLVAELKKPEHYNIKEFLTNPLLVTLLIAAFDYHSEIPIKKADFYSQIYDALYFRHDKSKPLTRNIKCRLDHLGFRDVLIFLGYESLVRDQLDFSENEILKLLNEYKESNYKDFDSKLFIEDLCVNVPLFVLDGLNYKWSHRSIQEYFGALYIYTKLNEGKASTFNMIISDQKKIEKYYNLLDLYAGIDRQFFVENFVYPFLKEQLVEYTTFYNTIPSNYPDVVKHLFLEYFVYNLNYEMILVLKEVSEKGYLKRINELRNKFLIDKVYPARFRSNIGIPLSNGIHYYVLLFRTKHGKYNRINTLITSSFKSIKSRKPIHSLGTKISFEKYQHMCDWLLEVLVDKNYSSTRIKLKEFNLLLLLNQNPPDSLMLDFLFSSFIYSRELYSGKISIEKASELVKAIEKNKDTDAERRSGFSKR